MILNMIKRAKPRNFLFIGNAVLKFTFGYIKCEWKLQ